jgi:Na+/H+ antiporter NhaD/arsenite permease-like protein
MRLEILPIIVGVIIGIIGLGLLFDAWAPDDIIVPQERRRRPRRDRDRLGEALVALGVLAIAAAVIGRDTWRYSIITVIAAAVLLLWGWKRNRDYLRGVFARADVPKVVEGTRRIRLCTYTGTLAPRP